MEYMSQMEIETASQKNRLFSIVESLLFVSGEPMKSKYIASILEYSKEKIEDFMQEMIESYGDDSRGIKIIKIDDSYQIVTKPENSVYIQKLLNVNVRQSLSQAALETLAIIAYKQPITRIEIEEIRGVKCDKAVVNLVEKGLVKECGRKEVPGRPILYATSDTFLKHFGLESLGDMPDLSEFEEHIVEEEKFNEDSANIENITNIKEIEEE
ncbi:SMC-Scp complex subunit ScpB [Haloimpatiens massiliensis]|uniref:SMC-Scp complex subunit ScpB n=1 Tax=Haloimpatiens massiliensis TaxID=1658110 RepID=UPI000C828133|nr:SMC-Scp complex subunit ScpB [Haloimpatiens massiliensis]